MEEDKMKQDETVWQKRTRALNSLSAPLPNVITELLPQL